MAVDHELALLRGKQMKLALAAGASACALTASMVAHAQPAQAPVEILTEEEEDELYDGDTVVVTGSRLRRSEFDSPKPLRVFETADAKQEGLFTASDILQGSSIAGGVQFDATFTGFVTDSGPGSATLNLRGLGADRTLILLNGRRLAPAGVQGAPTRPDLNLIPSGVLEQVDVLLDGASSVYGSDAVAGVANLITRKDFDGVEFNLNTRLPEASGGEFLQLTFTAGAASDRGHVLFGAEYRDQEAITRGQRDFTAGCVRDIESNPTTGDRRLICQNTGFGNMILDPTNAFFGANAGAPGSGTNFLQYWFDYPTGSGFTAQPVGNQFGGPGESNRGRAVQDLANPGSIVLGVGTRFPYDPRYNGNAYSDDLDLLQANEFFSAYANGEYDLTDRVSTFFETLYSNRSSTINAANNQIFPSVPCSNPFIQNDPLLAAAPVCNIPRLNTLGLDELIVLPYIAQGGAIGEVEVAQIRGVLGFRGDLEFLIPSGKYVTDKDFGLNIDNWTWEAYGSFDHSNGDFSSLSLNEDRLNASIRNVTQDPVSGAITCSPSSEDDLFGFIAAEECVPFDFTDPSIYLTGRLPQNLIDYVGGNATNRTVIEQQLLNGFITGDVFKLPDGVVPFLIGFEYRQDSIESYNSFQVTSGAATTVGREGDTFGTTDLMEIFLETEIPVLKGRPYAEELTIGLSGRWTEEKNFGALWTYGVNANYLPVEWLRFRGTFGTTFKAPNLRQQFLAGQTSFASAFIDPCIASVFNNFEPEEQAIIRANCTAQGADVDTLGSGGATSIPVLSGGNGLTLDAETSEGYTIGVAFEQPWTDLFDFEASVTYYSYEIENSIIAPGAGFILNDCLVNNPNQTSQFCSRITRIGATPDRNFVSELDASFINSGIESAKGLDYSLDISKEFVFRDRPLNVSWTGRVNQTTEREQTILDIFGDFLGNFGNPEWRGDFRAQVRYDDWTLTWSTDWIGEVDDAANSVDGDGDGIPDDVDDVRTDPLYDFGSCGVIVNDPVTGVITAVDSSTCTPVFAAGYRDVEEADHWFRNDVALNYNRDTWSATVGVRNVFDSAPPLVDQDEGISNSANVPLGVGYDIFGRSFFLNLEKSF